MKNENNEIVSMDYPDGSTHQVSFNEFYQIRIGDRDCYIARYVDHTLNANMITLISYDNGQWYKIPLNTDSYGYLNDYVDNHLNEALDASLYTLADHIRVTLPMEIGFVPVNSRISSNNGKPSLKPVFKISYYVPLSTNGVVFRNNIFRDITDSELDKNDDSFRLKKEEWYCNEIAYKTFKDGTKKYFTNHNGVKEYDYNVQIEPGVSAKKKVRLKDGTERELERIVLPGNYQINAFYSDFKEQEDYDKSRKARRITIPTGGRYKYPEQMDLAWKHAGKNELIMLFDSNLNVVQKRL